MKQRTMLLAAVCVMAAASFSLAEDKKDPASFLTKACQGHQTEIKLGELASEKASNAEVKEFARQMVDEHRQADKVLWEGREKPATPPELDAKQKETYDRLSKLTGVEFDREYMRVMVENHKKSVAMYEEQSKGGEDAAVKATAAKILPKIQQHLEKAQMIADKIK